MFKIKHTAGGHPVPWEYLPCGAIQPKPGLALYMSGGKLAVAGGANKAQYICVRQEKAAVTAGTIIPVMKIQPDQEWEVQGTADMVAGTGYDVASDGMSVVKASNTANFAVSFVNEETGLVRGSFVK